MQRILSILLAMVLGLGPAMSAVPASALTAGWGATQNESSLPACCRKNGAHHCAQSVRALTSSSETTISATNCCPCWPGTVASATASIAAVAHSSRSVLATIVEHYKQHSSAEAQDRTTQRTQPKRGPPEKTSI